MEENSCVYLQKDGILIFASSRNVFLICVHLRSSVVGFLAFPTGGFF